MKHFVMWMMCIGLWTSTCYADILQWKIDDVTYLVDFELSPPAQNWERTSDHPTNQQASDGVYHLSSNQRPGQDFDIWQIALTRTDAATFTVLAATLTWSTPVTIADALFNCMVDPRQRVITAPLPRRYYHELEAGIGFPFAAILQHRGYCASGAGWLDLGKPTRFDGKILDSRRGYRIAVAQSFDPPLTTQSADFQAALVRPGLSWFQALRSYQTIAHNHEQLLAPLPLLSDVDNLYHLQRTINQCLLQSAWHHHAYPCQPYPLWHDGTPLQDVARYFGMISLFAPQCGLMTSAKQLTPQEELVMTRWQQWRTALEPSLANTTIEPVGYSLIEPGVMIRAPEHTLVYVRSSPCPVQTLPNTTAITLINGTDTPWIEVHLEDMAPGWYHGILRNASLQRLSPVSLQIQATTIVKHFVPIGGALSLVLQPSSKTPRLSLTSDPGVVHVGSSLQWTALLEAGITAPLPPGRLRVFTDDNAVINQIGEFAVPTLQQGEQHTVEWNMNIAAHLTEDFGTMCVGAYWQPELAENNISPGTPTMILGLLHPLEIVIPDQYKTIAQGRTQLIPFKVFNFSGIPQAGTVTVLAPKNWLLSDIPRYYTIEPGSSQRVPGRLNIPATTPQGTEAVIGLVWQSASGHVYSATTRTRVLSRCPYIPHPAKLDEDMVPFPPSAQTDTGMDTVTCHVAWDQEGLLLGVTIHQDKYHKSLQIAIDPTMSGTTIDGWSADSVLLEVGFHDQQVQTSSLLGGWNLRSGAPPPLQTRIKREDSSTHYTIRIPWHAVAPLAPYTGRKFGLALSVIHTHEQQELYYDIPGGIQPPHLDQFWAFETGGAQ